MYSVQVNAMSSLRYLLSVALQPLCHILFTLLLNIAFLKLNPSYIKLCTDKLDDLWTNAENIKFLFNIKNVQLA